MLMSVVQVRVVWVLVRYCFMGMQMLMRKKVCSNNVKCQKSNRNDMYPLKGSVINHVGQNHPP